jgi:hypothetical protein
LKAISTLVTVHPYPSPPPQPSFFEREIAGVPIYVHLMCVLVSCGVYLVFLPFVLLIDGVQTRTSRAVDRVVDSILDRILKAALTVLAVPAYLIYELGRWVYRRWFAKPGAEAPPAPTGVDGGAGNGGGER